MQKGRKLNKSMVYLTNKQKGGEQNKSVFIHDGCA